MGVHSLGMDFVAILTFAIATKRDPLRYSTLAAFLHALGLLGGLLEASIFRFFSDCSSRCDSGSIFIQILIDFCTIFLTEIDQKERSDLATVFSTELGKNHQFSLKIVETKNTI